MFISIIELSAKNWGREPETEVTGAVAPPAQVSVKAVSVPPRFCWRNVARSCVLRCNTVNKSVTSI